TDWNTLAAARVRLGKYALAAEAWEGSGWVGPQSAGGTRHSAPLARTRRGPPALLAPSRRHCRRPRAAPHGGGWRGVHRDGREPLEIGPQVPIRSGAGRAGPCRRGDGAGERRRADAPPPPEAARRNRA